MRIESGLGCKKSYTELSQQQLLPEVDTIRNVFAETLDLN